MMLSQLKKLISRKELNEEKEKNEELWKPLTIYDIPPTTIQQMVLFLVYDEPKEMLKLRLLNKYFFNMFDIEYGGTNFLWKSICMNKFKNISSTFKTKRWDKLYQLRVRSLQQNFNSYQKNYSNINNIKDIEDICIEGCQNGLPKSQKLTTFQNIKLKTGIKSEYEILSKFRFENILIRNSMIENNYIWFIKCPILQPKLETNCNRYKNGNFYPDPVEIANYSILTNMIIIIMK